MNPAALPLFTKLNQWITSNKKLSCRRQTIQSSISFENLVI